MADCQEHCEEESFVLALLRRISSLANVNTPENLDHNFGDSFLPATTTDQVAADIARLIDDEERVEHSTKQICDNKEEVEDTPLQQCLCALWDVSSLLEVRRLLLETSAIPLLASCAARCSGPQGDRTSEIIAGIFANLVNNLEAARALTSHQPALVLCFMLMHVSDGPTLLELGRLFDGLLAHAYGNEDIKDSIESHICNDAFQDRVIQLLCIEKDDQVICAWLRVVVRLVYLETWTFSTTMQLVLSCLSCAVMRLSVQHQFGEWASDSTESSNSGHLPFTAPISVCVDVLDHLFEHRHFFSCDNQFTSEFAAPSTTTLVSTQRDVVSMNCHLLLLPKGPWHNIANKMSLLFSR